MRPLFAQPLATVPTEVCRVPGGKVMHVAVLSFSDMVQGEPR